MIFYDPKFPKDGIETSVYKAYSESYIWIGTIRHYKDSVAIEKLLRQYERINVIKKDEKIVWSKD